jgi:hypothetical protein
MQHEYRHYRVVRGEHRGALWLADAIEEIVQTFGEGDNNPVWKIDDQGLWALVQNEWTLIAEPTKSQE